MPRTKNSKSNLKNSFSVMENISRKEAEEFVDNIIYGIGAPLKYDKDFHPREALIAMAQGASKKELILELGVSNDTIWHWEKEYPEFRAAVLLGLELSEAWWRKQGRKNIHNPYFNQSLWMMNMSNRYGWTRRIQGALLTIGQQEADQTKQLEGKSEGEAIGNINEEETEEILEILIEAGAIIQSSEENQKEIREQLPEVKMERLHPSRANGKTKSVSRTRS